MRRFHANSWEGVPPDGYCSHALKNSALPNITINGDLSAGVIHVAVVVVKISSWRGTGADDSRYATARLSTFHYIYCEPSQARFLVAFVHVTASLSHSFNANIEWHSMDAITF